jgi:hypothetical protein
MLDEKAIFLNENLLTYRVYEITSFLVFVLPVFVITLFKLYQIFLYVHILFGHAAALAVALVRFSRTKLGRHIDVGKGVKSALDSLSSVEHNPLFSPIADRTGIGA